MNTSRSHALFLQAQQHIPGGVNSPVRAFRGVGGEPLFFKRGEGAYLIDEDDNRYIDYVGSWGPMIAGHAHPAVVKAVQEAAARSLGFGAPTAIEVEMAEKICALMPSIEMVRLVSSGTEATMSAIRLARGFTGRDKIMKFAFTGNRALFLQKYILDRLPARHSLAAEDIDIFELEAEFAEYPLPRIGMGPH